jgi:hypothetical protein
VLSSGLKKLRMNKFATIACDKAKMMNSLQERERGREKREDERG